MASSKKTIISVIITTVLIAAGVGCVVAINSPKEPEPVATIEKFELDNELFEKSELVEITAKEYAELIAAKKSFLVMVHMAICPAEMPLTSTTKQLIRQENFTIYSLLQDEFKETELYNSIKYLPSMAIIKDGELVKFLDAESNEDLPHYKTPESLKSWVETYVEL